MGEGHSSAGGGVRVVGQRQLPARRFRQLADRSPLEATRQISWVLPSQQSLRLGRCDLKETAQVLKTPRKSVPS